MHRKSIVIKIGGAVLSDEPFLNSLILPIQHFLKNNWRVVLVHGGGADINHDLKLVQVAPQYVNGVRVTDSQSLEVVEKVLSGKVNKQLVVNFLKGGIKTVGFSGKDGMLIQASKYESDIDYGLVGQVEHINLDLINMIHADWLIVLSPLGIGQDFNTYNINADFVAAAVAGALQAECLVFFTDVSGITVEGQHVSRLSANSVQSLISEGKIKQGMIPKSTSIIKALQLGVKIGLIMSKQSAPSLYDYQNDKSFIGTTIYI